MKTLLIAFAIAILFTLFVLPWIIRIDARIRAKQIIRGKRPSTKKQINRCIRVLTWSNKWFTVYEEPDRIRINQLRYMLDEMQKPNG
ncbi:hypothetical protein ES708_25204 [subsurface metagenome]